MLNSITFPYAQYLDAVVDATLGSGIDAQVAAVREGFNEVFDLSTLGCFFEDELETLVCGSGEHWTVQVWETDVGASRYGSRKRR